jgi:F0F1-type ATP synthase delta subunit
MGSEKVEVITTIPLTDEQREAIKAATGGLVYNTIGITRRQPEDVVAGRSVRAAVTLSIDVMCW